MSALYYRMAHRTTWIVDGIIGGVGGVIIFPPNIPILFFFISLMEDTVIWLVFHLSWTG
ncbi:MAG: hypothetical protein R2759_09425 [Bacteroidales bacterium]